MATYYSSPNNQREYLPNSYPEASVLSSNMMIYMGGGSSEPYSDHLATSSHQPSHCIEIQPDSTSQQHHQQDILSNLGGSHDYAEWRDPTPSIVHGGQGLSLSLGTQIPSVPFSFSTSNLAGPASQGFGDHQDSTMSHYGVSGTAVVRAVPGSKYLKAAQQLLDEVVNVRRALSKQSDGERSPNNNNNNNNNNKDGDDGGSKSESTPGTAGGDSSAGNSHPELSHSEKQDLQSKLNKLLSMLDEVDRRYKQYYHQMQIVVSSFDAIAGGGSAKPYTALALQTISRHFRCLRDAITGQIKATRRSLGEDEASGSAKGGGAGISRLRYVDQQLRQQRALQQLGMMQQHAWRPQRGLPENSVSILRAWLFEHFLHPYPKDSDKIMLARQTGLTRSQVSNWFINARVRLWKPMVEEMYKEETGEAEADLNSSSENAPKKRASEEETCEDSQSGPPKPDPAPPDVEMPGPVSVGPTSYGPRGLIMIKQQQQQQQHRRRQDECGSLYPDVNFHNHPDMSAPYQMSEMGRFGGGVSLTLGLHHCDGDGGGSSGMAMSGGPHHFVAMRGHDDDIYGGAGGAPADSSVGPDGAEFDQPRFGSSAHLLHDFVV